MNAEMSLVILAFVVITLNFSMAAILDPGYTFKHPQKKLNKKSLEMFKILSKEANDRKIDHCREKFDISMDENLKLPSNEFKDNYGFKLY
jgi:hypothetical protein